MSSTHLYLAVDVGTASVRVGFFDIHGNCLSSALEKICVFQSSKFPSQYEQNSEEIVKMFKLVATKAYDQVKHLVSNPVVAGVCFGATCSLVFADCEGDPITLVSDQNSEGHGNIIMWLDHRAEAETYKINATCHEALKFYGDGLSLEMEPPKLLWVKTHLPLVWDQFSIVLDLADFMTYKISRSSNIRSLCTMTCKWAYDAPAGDFRKSFWESSGLPDVYSRLLKDSKVCIPGENIPFSYNQDTLGDNLPTTSTIGISPGIIDAYAGVLGCLATHVEIDGYCLKPVEMGSMISGTSNCLFVLDDRGDIPPTVSGVWGPFWNVLGNRLWCYEGGQSAAGKLLDWLFEFHSKGSQMTNEDKNSLIIRLSEMAKAKNLESLHLLSRNIHICPDFHGNRSPLSRYLNCFPVFNALKLFNLLLEVT